MISQCRVYQELLREVLANPGDNLPRAVLADYLTDWGGEENLARAELIQAQLRGVPTDILAKYENTWAPPCLDGRFDWQRGFIDRVKCSFSWWQDHGQELCLGHPVRRVKLIDKEPYQWSHPSNGWIWYFPERDYSVTSTYQGGHHLPGLASFFTSGTVPEGFPAILAFPSKHAANKAASEALLRRARE